MTIIVWKFMDESFVKYIRVRKWGRWIRPKNWNQCFWNKLGIHIIHYGTIFHIFSPLCLFRTIHSSIKWLLLKNGVTENWPAKWYWHIVIISCQIELEKSFLILFWKRCGRIGKGWDIISKLKIWQTYLLTVILIKSWHCFKTVMQK